MYTDELVQKQTKLNFLHQVYQGWNPGKVQHLCPVVTQCLSSVAKSNVTTKLCHIVTSLLLLYYITLLCYYYTMLLLYYVTTILCHIVTTILCYYTMSCYYYTMSHSNIASRYTVHVPPCVLNPSTQSNCQGSLQSVYCKHAREREASMISECVRLNMHHSHH